MAVSEHESPDDRFRRAVQCAAPRNPPLSLDASALEIIRPGSTAQGLHPDRAMRLTGSRIGQKRDEQFRALFGLEFPGRDPAKQTLFEEGHKYEAVTAVLCADILAVERGDPPSRAAYLPRDHAFVVHPTLRFLGATPDAALLQRDAMTRRWSVQGLIQCKHRAGKPNHPLDVHVRSCTRGSIEQAKERLFAPTNYVSPPHPNRMPGSQAWRCGCFPSHYYRDQIFLEMFTTGILRNDFVQSSRRHATVVIAGWEMFPNWWDEMWADVYLTYERLLRWYWEDERFDHYTLDLRTMIDGHNAWYDQLSPDEQRTRVPADAAAILSMPARPAWEDTRELLRLRYGGTDDELETLRMLRSAFGTDVISYAACVIIRAYLPLEWPRVPPPPTAAPTNPTGERIGHKRVRAHDAGLPLLSSSSSSMDAPNADRVSPTTTKRARAH